MLFACAYYDTRYKLHQRFLFQARSKEALTSWINANKHRYSNFDFPFTIEETTPEKEHPDRPINNII